MTADDDIWMQAHTATAPERLRDRAVEILTATPAEDRSDRLVAAGRTALQSAIAAGSDRRAALDLLAADALITLALLDIAERAPADLAGRARAIRLGEGA